MLGMVSGWSSTFEPEPADHSSTDTTNEHKEPEHKEEEHKVLKPVTSFHGILTDYAIVGSKKYTSNEYASSIVSSPSDKVLS